jgi:pimeloyl-ACP methyl ester carboxylesterase
MDISMTTGLNRYPLALLIPGLDGTGRLFYRQLEALGARYRVCPWSYGPETDFDLHDLARKLGEATAEEKPGSILVVGESFGGLVALDYVLRYPERVQRLVLENAFPYYRRRLRVRLAHALIPLLLLSVGQRIKDIVVDRTLRREGILVEDRRLLQEAMRHINLGAYRRRLELIRKVDLRPHLRQITVPTVLLASGRDKLVPSIREAHFMASQIPNARVHEFPEAGHALLLTPGISLADYV